MGMNPLSDKLTSRLKQMVGEGLVSIQFDIRNKREATVEAVCREVTRLYEAVDRGEESDLIFNDAVH